MQWCMAMSWTNDNGNVVRLQHDWLRVNKAAITSEVVISAASTNVHDLGVAIRNKTSTHRHGHGWGGAATGRVGTAVSSVFH